MQHDTHTNWQTGEERTDRAGAKSAAARTYDDDTFFDFFRAHHGKMCTHAVE